MPVLHSGSMVLCSGTVRRAPLDATMRAAATAGFDGVSPYHDEYRPARDHGWSDAAIRALLDDPGVAVAELDGAMRWLPPLSRSWVGDRGTDSPRPPTRGTTP